MNTKTTFKEAVLRIIAVIGLLAILLLGAWGIIQLAFFISSLFSNAGGAVSTVTTTQTHESVTISVPASATPGTPTTINWNLSGGSANYSYALSYSCTTGLTFKAPVPTGATQSVPCNTPFNYTQATNSLTITPVYSGTTDAQTTITVTATNLSTGAIVASATGNMTVVGVKKAAAATTYTTSPKTTYVASGRTTNLYGYPDLAVSIVSATSRSGNATVQFVVQNLGTNVSPANWSFNAILPINGSYTYPSGPQRALYPGDKIVYTLNFSDYSNSTYNSGYTYGTCNQYGPCAVPGYSGGYSTGCVGYSGNCIGSQAYNPYTTTSYNPYGYAQTTKAVTIQVDPYNYIYELTKANNYATANYISSY
jgi:hypothetical protein